VSGRGLDPQRLVRPLRLLTLALAAAGALYLWRRYDLMLLPAGGCSPLASLAPGDRLLLDRRPRAPVVGDALVFAGPENALHLAVVRQARGSGDARELWLETEVADCPGPDSRELGWIPARSVRARVLLALPW